LTPMGADDFSYNHNPEITDRVSLIRLMIGDTDKNEILLTDEEICLALNAQPINTYAAAACADFIAAKFAREVQRTRGAVSAACNQRFLQYKELARCLRAGGPGDLPGGDGTGVPTLGMRVGGITFAGNDALRDDSDAVPPTFALGQTDNERVSTDRNDEDGFRHG